MKIEKAIKILMLEDNKDDVKLIEHTLQRSAVPFVAAHVDTKIEFTNALHSFQPDVILSDHGLPQFNSREALKICMREGSSAPFILVTGTMSDEFAISCLNEGADDYILKSNLSRLPMAIRIAMKSRKLDKLKKEARHALRKQNQELLRVNMELDNFVYSVSHNLRGPLATVMGLLNLAKTVDNKKELRSIHMMMTKSLSRLDETITEILDYSRNEREEIRREELNWKELIHYCFRKLEYIEGSAHPEKVINLDTETPFYSDQSRISTVMLNLLSNAMLFSEKNRESLIGVDIYTTKEEAIIVVKDNGIGIEEKTLPKVFNMFFRGTQQSHGAGLGLYITREIVRKLGGDIQIASVYGEQTTVTITIPNLH